MYMCQGRSEPEIRTLAWLQPGSTYTCTVAQPQDKRRKVREVSLIALLSSCHQSDAEKYTEHQRDNTMAVVRLSPDLIL